MALCFTVLELVAEHEEWFQACSGEVSVKAGRQGVCRGTRGIQTKTTA